ncbi:hypothetical protein C0992_007201 [Termitomyces sp. T32_za158]|nr:hypothetical protein C0992_007201 [Termitomyces sp. T32_za158]
MLKRQRLPSPPSFLPSIPLVDEPYSDAMRDVKRRRILDGTSKGWAVPDSPDDDDDEGYISHHENPTQPHAELAGKGSANYKQTNTVLQELHTLHQHRLLFASYASSSQAPTHSHCLTQFAQSNHDGVPAKVLTSHPEVSGSSDTTIRRYEQVIGISILITKATTW